MKKAAVCFGWLLLICGVYFYFDAQSVDYQERERIARAFLHSYGYSQAQIQAILKP